MGKRIPIITKFIVLSGKKQTGKDLASRIIESYLKDNGYSVSTTYFAEPLKLLCVQILGLTPQGVYGTNEQKNELSHVLWDGFSREIREKYSIESYGCPDSFNLRVPILRNGKMTNREVLQVIGTDVFRSIWGDVWAEAPFRKSYDSDFVIITDARFPNEISVTKRHGGCIIRLERSTNVSDMHESEIALDEMVFENKYENNGTIEELSEWLTQIISTYLATKPGY